MLVLIGSILMSRLGLELKVLPWWRRVEGWILKSLQASICSVEIKHMSLQLQVAKTCWTTEVRLGSDTTMLNVSWLVRRLVSVGEVKGLSTKLAGLHFKMEPMLVILLVSEPLSSRLVGSYFKVRPCYWSLHLLLVMEDAGCWEVHLLLSRCRREVLTELETRSKICWVGSWVYVARRVLIHYYQG
jgi:hypothetical protein